MNVFRVVIHTKGHREQPFTVWAPDGWIHQFCASLDEVRAATKKARSLQWTIEA